MSLRTRLIAGAAAVATSVMGLMFIQKEEGVVYTAYPDPVHGWAVPTICSGHTSGVKRGDVASHSECIAYLRTDTEYATKGVLRCTYVPLMQHELDALVSFTFNVGVGAYCKSTMRRLINRVDFSGAAQQFDRWTYAGGRDCKIRANGCYGIYTRRMAEKRLFQKGEYE